MTPIFDAIEALKGRLSANVSALIAQLDTVGGKLVTSKENLALVTEIISQVKNTMFDDQFIEAVAEYLNSFDAVGIDAVKAMESFGTIDPAITDAIVQQYKLINASEILTPSTYSDSVFAPIANDLLLGIATGALVNTVINAATSRLDNLSAPVDALVGSSGVTLQRTLTTTISEQVGVKFFYYQGRPIRTTREFCREREGHVWHLEEVKQWGRDAAAGNGWPGMVEGTDQTSIFVHLGGYYGNRMSCRHVLVPVDIMDVPPEDLARMKRKGLVK